MDEVDSIIIDSLRNLNCDIDEDVTSLRGFTADMVVSAIVCCLESISPGINLSKRMPASMSSRLKYSSQLVEHIQNVGFRGDIGYQTILYVNELELRRVLMYLIEQVPRESNKEVVSEAVGYVPRLVKEIEENIRLALRQPWVPSDLLYHGARCCDDRYIQHSYGNSHPLRTEDIKIPNSSKVDDDLKKYWIHHLPEVTKQCTPTNLIPSLLFNDNDFSSQNFKLNEIISSKIENISVPSIEQVPEISLQTSNHVDVGSNNHLESKIVDALKQLELKKEKYLNLQKELKTNEVKYNQLESKRAVEESQLNETVNKLNVKSKTLAVLSKDENLSKLKTLVENGNKRLLDLANQWSDVQSPLVEEYRALQGELSEQEIKSKEEKDKLLNVQSKVKEMEQEISDKGQLESSLKVEYQKLNKHSNRSSYTRRILEIIGNIKKQDSDIAKILKDTRDVQKEINQLTGQLERSFMLADALIFKDAKHDEVSRKAYKLLASLHFDCESIILAVTEMGSIERESRNIQDQIDAELGKDMANKLEKIIADINELRQERQQKT